MTATPATYPLPPNVVQTSPGVARSSSGGGVASLPSLPPRARPVQRPQVHRAPLRPTENGRRLTTATTSHHHTPPSPPHPPRATGTAPAPRGTRAPPPAGTLGAFERPRRATKFETAAAPCCRGSAARAPARRPDPLVAPTPMG